MQWPLCTLFKLFTSRRRGGGCENNKKAGYYRSQRCGLRNLHGLHTLHGLQTLRGLATGHCCRRRGRQGTYGTLLLTSSLTDVIPVEHPVIFYSESFQRNIGIPWQCWTVRYMYCNISLGTVYSGICCYSIPDPTTATTRCRREKFLSYRFWSHKCHKIILFLNRYKTKFEPIDKKFWYFLLGKLSLNSHAFYSKNCH